MRKVCCIAITISARPHPAVGYRDHSPTAMDEPAQRVSDEGDRGDLRQRMRQVDPGYERLRSSGMPGERRRIVSMASPFSKPARHFSGGVDRTLCGRLCRHEFPLSGENGSELARFLT